MSLTSLHAGGTAGAVAVDVAALQSPTSRGRGIGRHTLEWALAVEAADPELVCAYLLDPALPPPGDIEALLATGKVAYRSDRLPRSARVLHSCSPLDLAVGLDTLWPSDPGRRLHRSATVYDLIPAKDPASHLVDPLTRWQYQIRLETVRAADQLHAISAGVAADLRGLLEVPAARVVVAGTAPAAHFRARPPGQAGAATEAVLLEAAGIRGRFVLYPTGSHPRKNNEGLLRAFGLLPEGQRRTVQLVLTGELPPSMAHHLRHMAAERGFADALVLPGVLDEATLLACYRGATLVCFPSLAEGFGLPIAEALACGTPAIGSDRSPIDELLPEQARFDPADDQAMATALEAALASEAHRRSLLEATAAPPSWAKVGRRSAAALTELAGRPARRPRRPRRPRIALVTPLPPSETGIAAYSARLVDALAGLGGLAVDCFTDGPTPDQQAPGGAERTFPAALLPAAESLCGGYDAVLYTLGNSHFHLGALAGLRRRPGVVLAHDVRLSNLYRHDVARRDEGPGGLSDALHRLYGDSLPAGLGADDDLSAADLERFGLLMAREAIAASTRYLVTSRAAVALATTEARPVDRPKLACLPFAFAPPGSLRSPTTPHWPEDGTTGPIVAHFGIVDPVKEPFRLLEAFRAVRDRWSDARLRFVGPVADTLADELRRRAAALGLGDALELTGPVPAPAYAAALETATVAVQLRATSNGEASAAVGDCLAAGLPTVVTAIGWGRELPGEAVVRVPRAPAPDALGDVLVDLLADGPRRVALEKAARAEADRRSFRATAEALVGLAGLDACRGDALASGGAGELGGEVTPAAPGRLPG